MPSPTKYTRQYDYVSYQNGNPTRPLPADKVNADLNQVALSTKEIVDFLKTSLRADGAIMNGAVGRAQINPSVNLGFMPPTEWASSTIYTANVSTVFYSDAFYSAIVSHTSSGSFDPSKWALIADFEALANDAAALAISSNPNLYAISQLASAADKGIVFTGAGTAMTFDLSTFARTLLDDTTAGSALTTLGVSAYVKTLLDDADGPTALATLGAVPLAGGTMTGALTLSADPASALQAATKQYVDAVAQGLDTKASVVVATTANITLSAPQTIDGVALTAGDRVLVRNQSTASQNGIYLVAAGAWTRALDADAWAELPGAFVFVEKGTVNSDSGWVCTVDSGGTIGSTNVTFAQFSGAGTYTAGSGLTLTGTQFSVTTNGMTNAMRAQMAAYTIKGNATGSTANEADISIPALTHKTVPVGADKIMIADSAASNALVYSTLTETLGAVVSGVSSIAGNTGAFTLSNGIGNTANDIQLNINGLTTDTAPNTINDFVATYDASAGTNKKVKLSSLSHKGYFLVNRNGTSGTGTAVTSNKISFTNEVVDSAGWFDNATNFRFQPLEAGYYTIGLSVASAGNVSGSPETCQAVVTKNGTTVFSGLFIGITASIYSFASGVVFLNGSTDYVEGNIYLPGGITSYAGNTDRLYMYGWKVGD